MMRPRLRHRGTPWIEFLCNEMDRGVIAEPVPARRVLPAWFGDLAGVDLQHLSAINDGLTVKRCMPFLDAMSTGWIIPLAATVRLEISNDGANVTAGWEFDRTMVSNHGAHQVAGNPREPRPPMKFHNYWTVRTPPGWSCLFVPPLNRANGPIEVLSGVVDTDTFHAPVNFPFVAIGDDGVHVLRKGTPIVQVIPFERTNTAVSAQVRTESEPERLERLRVHRSVMAGDSWYRRHARSPRRTHAKAMPTTIDSSNRAPTDRPQRPSRQRNP